MHYYHSMVSFARMLVKITLRLGDRAGFLFLIFVLLLMCQTSTTISMASSTNPAILGQGVTLSASINPSQATGEVTFYDESVILGIAPAANGSATLSTILLNPGQRSLTARFESRAGFAASASKSITVTVNADPSSVFGKPTSYPTTSTSNASIAVADFNGDGHLDIVTNAFTVLMGNSDGTIQPPVYYTSSIEANAVAVGDFNGENLSRRKLELGRRFASGFSLRPAGAPVQRLRPVFSETTSRASWAISATGSRTRKRNCRELIGFSFNQ